MLITALRDMHLEITTSYIEELDDVDTAIEVVTKGQTFSGDILEDRHDYFDFQFDDGSVGFSLEKKLWEIC